MTTIRKIKMSKKIETLLIEAESSHKILLIRCFLKIAVDKGSYAQCKNNAHHDDDCDSNINFQNIINQKFQSQTFYTKRSHYFKIKKQLILNFCWRNTFSYKTWSAIFSKKTVKKSIKIYKIFDFIINRYSFSATSLTSCRTSQTLNTRKIQNKQNSFHVSLALIDESIN
ncbi:hypothetical protein BpHYR1_001282 [Brachionus plicatilis]|uniref:Uncharacterized protein n=1 Tax=Brachionus plicatilis TaxID=10195 RepID=A0A3M7P6U0_BRAPC|nr:hypothetical protein BpHYR1_001282 [Brachionus plicatilis]